MKSFLLLVGIFALTAISGIAQCTFSTTFSKTNVSCFGGNNGTARVIPSGGTAPYTYSWSTSPVKTTDTIKNVYAGTYVVTVTDSAGCIKVDSVTITQPSKLYVVCVSKDTHCNGGNNGTATANGSGGAGSYTYTWNSSPPQTGPTANGLSPGVYIVTCTDANGCTDTESVTVMNATKVSGTVTKTNVTCNGTANGTATAVGTGGIPGYTYTWNTSPAQNTATATGLGPGTYTVTISDQRNCKEELDITITQPPAILLTKSHVNVSCNGGSNGTATVNASGGVPGYTYSWNTTPAQTTAAATSLPAGIYTVTVKDSLACTKTLTDTVTQPAALSINVSKTNINCFGGSNGTATATASNGTSPYQYSWNTIPVKTTAGINNLPPGTYTVTVTDAKNCINTADVVITQPPLLTSSVSKASPVCNGGNNGTASVVPSGGTSPYSYSWNTTPVQTGSSVTGLAAGTYIATITDANNCTKKDTLTITQPPSVQTVVNGVINVSCYNGNNGSATVVPSGGTNPYSYSWNTSPVQTAATANNLIAGTYIVTTTDSNSCIKKDTVVITQPVALNGTIINVVNTNCNSGNDGAATATGIGGTIPYNYSWSTSPVQTAATATGLSAGMYSVTITDAKGCTKVLTVTISQPAVLQTSTSRSNVTCNGGNNGLASVSANGGITPYSYSWSTLPVQTTTTATNLAAGVYLVVVTDSKGCAKTDTVTILQPTVLQSAVSTTNVSCHGGSNGNATVSVSGGTSPYSYYWNTNPAQTNATATNLKAGIYTVLVLDANGCTNTKNVTITEPSAINVTINQTDVSCYNGNNGVAIATVTGGTLGYTYSWNTSPIQTAATANNLSAGTYVVTITDSNNCTKKDTAIITEPALLNAAITTTTNISCYNGNNGSATVTPSGGTTPYTYSWSTTPVQTTATALNLSSGTYAVTVTDLKGCVKTINTTIIQPAAMQTTVTNTAVSCFNGSNGGAVITAIGGSTPYSYSWSTSPVQTSAVASGISAGTYYVTVTDFKGCTKTDSTTIVQPTVLQTTATKTDVSCNGGSNGAATISVAGGVSPYSYSWGTTPVQTGATATNLSSGIVTVTVTDANNCIRTHNVTVNQPALINAVFNKTGIRCFNGSDGATTALVTGGTSPYTYSWSTTPVQTTANITNLAAGIYSVTITDANGCIRTITDTVTQPSQVALAISKKDVSCYGQGNGSATVTASGGTAPYAYNWNTTPAQTTANAINLAAGIYTVIVTDDNGCIRSDNVTVTQPALLQTVMSQNNVSCFAGNNANITSLAYGGTMPYSYSWNTTPVQTTPVVNSLSAGTYVLTVTDSHACQRRDTVIISQPAVLNSAINKTNVRCSGDSTGEAFVVASGGTKPYSYLWYATPFNTTDSIKQLPAGTYKIVVTDSNGCTKTDSATISQPPAFTVTVSKTDVLCFNNANGTAAAIPGGGTPPYNLSWNTVPVKSTLQINNLTPGAYTVSVFDANGCSVSATTNPITQPDSLFVEAEEVLKTCPAFANGEATIKIAKGGTSPYSVAWGTIPQQVTNIAVNLGAGIYSVSVTDANGCLAQDTVAIGNYPKPVIDAGADQIICDGMAAFLHVTGADSFSWSSPSTLTCVTCASPIARPRTTTLYEVIGTNIYGCRDTDEVNVAVIKRVPVSVGPEIKICKGEGVQLHAEGGVQYEWSPGINLNDSTISDPVYAADSSMDFRVVITENECFKDTLYQQVKVYLMPTIELGKDIDGFPGSEFELNALVTNTTKITWTPPVGFSCLDCPNTRVRVWKTTTYTAIASNEDVCFAKDDITIRVACDSSLIFVPNTFTPNRDGINDRFYVSAASQVVIDDMRIYSRWGELLYERKNFTVNEPAYGWDGTYKYRELSPDVYVYYLQITCQNGQRMFFKGDISLIR